MKRIFILLAIFAAILILPAHAQNLTTISASNLQDINGVKLAAGQLCFLVTDQNDNPISVSLGGGGQTLRRGYCSQVANGAATPFTVPNPASTLPSGIYYRVTVKDSSNGQEVLRYTQVTFTGATFNFDNYAPANIGSFALLTGNNVSGNLSVTGNLSATGAITASNIPGSIPGAGSCTNQFVRTLTSGSPPTCNTVGSADLASSLALNTATITSSTASPATAGNMRLASGDAIDWRNNAGSSNLPLQKTGPVSGNTPADSLDVSAFGGIKAPSLLQIGGTDTGLARTAAGNIALGNGAQADGSGTVLLSNVKQGAATTPLTILDNLGGTHFFISGTSPYVNTFVTGNGTGNVFLGSAAKTSVADTSGNITMSGSTSGATTLQASATASGTLTLPAATDTLVARTTTDTLTNKTLGGSGATAPFTAYNRMTATQGSALVIGDVGSFTGFGSTTSVNSIFGTDGAGIINLTSSGTGQTANPTFTLTFHDGAWPKSPIVVVSRADANAPAASAYVAGVTTTTVIIGLMGTPVAGTTYGFNFYATGRP